MMSKEEYLRILEEKLRRLSETDREKALEYYEEYFEDAGKENESRVMEELGHPEDVARQLVMNLAVEKMDEPKASLKKRFSGVKIALVALFAAPVGLPLLILLLLAILLVLMSAWLVVGVLFAASFLLVGMGIFSLAVSIMTLFSSPLDGLAIFGVSLFVAGVGLLLYKGMLGVAGQFIRALSYLLKKMMKKEAES